jgi:glycosyltransferase involved in cell wall biosynthesis
MKLTLIMPYYNNARMLAYHYEKWAGFSTETKMMFDVVIVDDGSQIIQAVNVPRPEGLPRIRIYRIKEDKDWNWCGARNLGAKVADGEWLLLTDMDHLVPEGTVRGVCAKADPTKAYKFTRLCLPDMKYMVDENGVPKPHANTWCMTQKLFWTIGGYDEFFAGHYGFDADYLKRVKEHAQVEVRKEVVVNVPRHVIPDASTDNKARKAARPQGYHKMIRKAKAKSTSPDAPLLFQFTWERVL